ncbi:RNA-binding transcriptional accessory protein [Vulcanibacillus modesticaldus]|uniref:RNA-binding transcriptional accessory protein n=1 Tax=Vulcanibacillus modesticaldus TaxID=337097 RepID=A0A1D2YX90_9BACI|nr:Tex family protein [Vulcanibacillus modesticaldus]OEG00253.1 RNA-binding transcriptional accessory protein [Vulcanibacillus modesticaldus]
MEPIQFMIDQISEELKIKKEQTKQVIRLLDEGNTIPFIARYRKELTGQLDETTLRNIFEKITYLRNLHQRKEEVIRLIEAQGKLTDELRKEIESASKLQRVEDLYRPYKPKRRTRASIAKEKGLEPFAEVLLEKMDYDQIVELAQKYISKEYELSTVDEVIQGGQDIIAEMISDDPVVREWVRNETFNRGIIRVQAKDSDKESVYEMYYDYQEPIKNIRHHRVLAINRGEKEDYLKVKIQIDEKSIIDGLVNKFSLFSKFRELPRHLTKVVEDSYKRLISPSIEREIRQLLTEKAEDGAIQIFSANLRQLLLQPPIKGKTILGIDPAYRTGCKLAVVNPVGKVEDIRVIYPTPPQNKVEEAKKQVKDLVEKFGIEIIVIGNGTASRETEQFVADFISEHDKDLYYIIVSEAGASVYSASRLAKEEFPDLDVSERSAISIARRIQDPLAELVKIDPKSVGVGQYQHDVSQKKLEASLTQVVESVVNYVGVDINTASISLLQYISGMNKTVAKNIVEYREKNGKFKNREELKEVPRFGAKTYEQAIGFLRIDGENPLDKTSIHPESYAVTYALLDHINLTTRDIGTENLKQKLKELDLEKLSKMLDVGLPTLNDIVASLIRPFRDPRDELPKPIFHKDILKIEDLKQGMHLQGTVRNIVDFGAFIDIGVKEDGLVHISEMSEKYIKHPLDVVSVGDIIDVWVLSTDVQKKRISLTMKKH